MDVKKMVLRVNINCIKCKRDIMQCVSKLEGINEMSIDSGKGQLTVIGSVDPFVVTKQLRKKGKFAEIISVGPPKKETPKIEHKPLPSCCKQCQLVAFGFETYPSQPCSIL